MSEQEAPVKRAMSTRTKNKPSPEQAHQPDQEQQEQAGSQAEPSNEHQEGAAGQARPYQPKPIGQPWTNHKDVPQGVVEAALARFGRPGVQLQMAVPRENGSYKGEALEAGDYLVQRVGENSAVFHRKQDITLSDKLEQHRKYVNGAQVSLFYEGNKGKAYPYDPVAERIDIFTANFKKMAAKLNVPNLDQFKSSMDEIKTAMHAELRMQRQEQRDKREQARQERTLER